VEWQRTGKRESIGPGALRWSFHNPVRVRFGRGVRQELVDELNGLRCLIVCTKRGRAQICGDDMLHVLADSDPLWVDTVSANPGINGLQIVIDRLRGENFDAIVAVGGGSALDSAKVLATALAADVGSPALRDLLAQPALHARARPKRLFAVPTTAGTGSEVTPFATLWDHEARKKYSLAGPSVFPYAAYVDAALTDGLPEEVTVSTGLDAINQAAESIWNRNATPLTLDLAMRALALGFAALPLLVHGAEKQRDRDAMAECSVLAGLAISQTRTALCHSMSYPITAHFGVPHGLACAFTMAAVLNFNLQADDGRLSWLALALGYENVDALAARIQDVLGELGVSKRIAAYVEDPLALLDLAPQMLDPGRAGNNLRAVQLPDVEAILRASAPSVPRSAVVF
jgi:alcohol dehydrogenase